MNRPLQYINWKISRFFFFNKTKIENIKCWWLSHVLCWRRAKTLVQIRTFVIFSYFWHIGIVSNNNTRQKTQANRHRVQYLFFSQKFNLAIVCVCVYEKTTAVWNWHTLSVLNEKKKKICEVLMLLLLLPVLLMLFYSLAIVDKVCYCVQFPLDSVELNVFHVAKEINKITSQF